MRNKFALALLTVALLSFGLWNQHGKAASDSVNTYEYMVILDSGVAGNVKGLNEYGAQGWKVVAAAPNAGNGVIVLYLKRTRKPG
jgi:hypothetical protein